MNPTRAHAPLSSKPGHGLNGVPIESGTLLTWLQRQLGHSSLNVTADTYGHFETAARKLEAAKMEDAFAV